MCSDKTHFEKQAVGPTCSLGHSLPTPGLDLLTPNPVPFAIHTVTPFELKCHWQRFLKYLWGFLNHLRKIQLSSIICAKHFYCIQILGITIIADYNPSFSPVILDRRCFPLPSGSWGLWQQDPKCDMISSWLMAATEKPSLCRAGCKGPQHFCTASLHTLLFLQNSSFSRNLTATPLICKAPKGAARWVAAVDKNFWVE